MTSGPAPEKRRPDRAAAARARGIEKLAGLEYVGEWWAAPDFDGHLRLLPMPRDLPPLDLPGHAIQRAYVENA